MQRWLINPFISRPEHSQFILLVAVAIILANGLLIVFGPDARSVQTSYAFDSFMIGPLIVDATKTFAGAASLLSRQRCLHSFVSPGSARRSEPAPTTTPARRLSASMSRVYMR